MPSLQSTIERFFRRTVRSRPGDGLVVAFSGGPDSTALLLALSRGFRPSDLRLIAAHLDHALDPGSAERAERAGALARRIGVPLVIERRPVKPLRRSGESLEEAARRVRYAFLEEVRLTEGARWIATAHHRDDQAETLVLRLLYGTGLDGLAGIRPVRDRLLRPLLDHARRELEEVVHAAGLEPLDDPTNRDPFAARNRVRHELLPALAHHLGGTDAPEESDPGEILRDRLAGLAEAADGARRRLETLLERCLAPEPLRPGRSGSRGIRIDPAGLAELPEPLFSHGLAFLHRRAGAPYPAGAPARAELVRQLRRSGDRPPDGPGAANGDLRVGCDVGGGWRWRTHRGHLELRPPEEPRREEAGARAALVVSYRLDPPGEVDVPELGLRIRVVREAVAPWMFRGSRRRAALELPPLSSGTAEGGLTVRTRRPGDRIHPLGAPGERKLKDVLIDRRIPRDRRDRLPLLCFGDRIAWVPGVTVDERFRVAPDAEAAWVAEVVPWQTSPDSPSQRSSRSSKRTRSSGRSSTSAGD